MASQLKLKLCALRSTFMRVYALRCPRQGLFSRTSRVCPAAGATGRFWVANSPVGALRHFRSEQHCHLAFGHPHEAPLGWRPGRC